ncbi:MAG: tRNA uridine-5-carboxymethylaminomethyl(34) synthesis GTPase MnmE [Flavobacteriaceae bacterium]|jgi:tRNA modification GTPase|nr:tRNA uridine-5-carboxymethylaminomethyl(34) synthesis GTPase MnmE [Flavobacteriaceae bacterium]MDG1919595.1 tRNA uridine-5-carboxymethylaminomethyl(34) synthesis GTPase MnmE [Flavobacteriaceae bacterium]
MLTEGTVIALATPEGSGAIGVIRLSGEEAFHFTAPFFQPKSKESWDKIQANTTVLGDFVSEGEIIDEVLLTKFKAPNSYTGENVVEISCHGSSYIQQKIISCFLIKGVKPAQAGEFTLRAYLNQKMDLSQAEAVADLIAAESEAAHQLALQQMRGGFSKKMEALRQELIQFKALIELELDFSEEEVEFANLEELRSLLNKLHKDISDLKNSFAYGNVIKKGVPVAIAGKPNVGKSSLLNALFEEEKAIVSNIPGTTRDSIEDTLVLGGILFRFIDTAGLRETNDVVEAIGVKKAREKVKKARVLIYLYQRDTTAPVIVNEIQELHHEGLSILLVENKIDLYDNTHSEDLASEIKSNINFKSEVIALGISTKNSMSLAPLKNHLVTLIQNMKSESNLIIHNSRHFHALSEALRAIETIQEGLDQALPGDLLSIELKEAIHFIGSITGNIDNDQDILGTIFSQFCIGK